MLMPIDIRRAAASCWSFAHLAEAMGVVSGWRCSEDWLFQFIRRNDIDLSGSPYWHELDQRPLGLALIGVRGSQAWLGTLGLAPECRGRGLAGELLAEALQPARDAGLRRVLLEVAHGNEKGLRVYQKAGFRPVRELDFLDAPAFTAPALVAEAQDPARLPATPGLPWNRNIGAQYCQALAWDGGWVKFRLDADTCYLVDTDVPQRPDQVMGALQTGFPGYKFAVLNEPVGSPLHTALTAVNWTTRVRQQEMVLSL